MNVGQEEGTTWLYFDARYRVADGSNVVTIRAKTNLGRLVDPIVGGRRVESREGSDHEEGFDDILITQAGADGQVIFQQRGSSLRLVSLDKLTSAADEGKTIDLNTLGQSSNVADVKLAGADYKLFLHPVNLSISQTGADDARRLRWVICGLVPASHFRREVWTISYSILIVFAFFTALSILSWPFLKLVLIGPKDRLRTADIYFLFFSTLIGLALLTTLGLYGYSYIELGREMDGQLETLAKQVKENFQAEVTASLNQLDGLNRDTDLRGDFSKLSGGTPGSATPNGEKDRAKPKRWYRTGILKNSSVPPAYRSYPYFDTAVWIDEKGRQRLKWTVESYQPQFIDVSDRPYFTNLKAEHYRHFDCHDFWLDPIVSKTTGRNEVEISKWKTGDGAEDVVLPCEARSLAPTDGRSHWVSAFDTRLLSLMQPVLPAGFGFCVIDEEGRVLFHSDEAHHLGENFFEESDNDHSLRSAVIDRREMPLDVNYLGRGHRLFATPLKSFPGWTLITFRDKQVLRTAFLELLTLSSLLFLGYCLVILIFLSVFYLVNLNTSERRAWLWPSSRRTLSYYVSVLILLGLSAVSAVMYNRGGPRSVIAVGVISFVGLYLFFLNLRFGKYGRAWRGLKESGLWGRTYSARKMFYRYDLGYVLNIVLLFLLIAIIPAAAFFKFAYEVEMKLFVKHGQITVAKGLAERDERIRAQYVSRWGNDDRSFRETFTANRLKLDWDIYDGFFFGTTRRQDDDGTPVGAQAQDAGQGKRWTLIDFLASFNDFMPLYNSTSIERLGLRKGAFADGSYDWVETPAGIELHINDGGPNNLRSPWKALVTKVPPFDWPGRPWWMVFLLACIPFYLWVGLMVRKIFLLNLHRPTSYSFETLQARTVGGNLFVILEPPFTQSRRLDGEKFHYLSLRDMSESSGWAEAFDYGALRGADKIVAVDHFEHMADDPEANRRKAHFLEELLRRGHRVFVISTIDPSRYSFADGAGSGAAAPDGVRSCEEFDRWSGLVSNFFTVYAEDQGEAESFVREVTEERQRLLDEGRRAGKSRDEIDNLLAALKEECSPRVPLQRLGSAILHQPKFVNLTREHLIGRVKNPADELTIHIVGKYVGYEDSYKSLNEALYHGGFPHRLKVNIKWIEAEALGIGYVRSQIRDGAGINDIVACRTMPSSRAPMARITSGSAWGRNAPNSRI